MAGSVTVCWGFSLQLGGVARNPRRTRNCLRPSSGRESAGISLRPTLETAGTGQQGFCIFHWLFAVEQPLTRDVPSESALQQAAGLSGLHRATKIELRINVMSLALWPGLAAERACIRHPLFRSRCWILVVNCTTGSENPRGSTHSHWGSTGDFRGEEWLIEIRTGRNQGIWANQPPFRSEKCKMVDSAEERLG